MEETVDTEEVVVESRMQLESRILQGWTFAEVKPWTVGETIKMVRPKYIGYLQNLP